MSEPFSMRTSIVREGYAYYVRVLVNGTERFQSGLYRSRALAEQAQAGIIALVGDVAKSFDGDTWTCANVNAPRRPTLRVIK